MKKSLIALLCCLILLLCACNTESAKYKRISFESETLDDQYEYLSESTGIENQASVSLPSQVPIYRIEERIISDDERQLLMSNLGLPTDPYHFRHEGNSIVISLASYTDFDRGFFTMTEDEAKEQAWALFNKIPFIEGEYECIGIRDQMTLSDQKGTHITRAGVVFCRVLDGVRVTGDGACTLSFDGSGLVEISIKLYDYKKIGTMDMVSLADAEAKLKTPDDFDISTGAYKRVDQLQVERVNLRLVNQYSRGCAILQPIYYFAGTATLEDESQADFSSKIIAIPETMTYVEE